MKQVEYQFSDISLLANETLAKHISKDPEGYGKHYARVDGNFRTLKTCYVAITLF